MSAGSVGFILGAAPGLVLALSNMRDFQRSVDKVQALARSEHKGVEFNLSYLAKFNFWFRPDRFFDPRDSHELKEAKLELIAGKWTYLTRHAIAALITVTCALVGAFVGVSVGDALGN